MSDLEKQIQEHSETNERFLQELVRGNYTRRNNYLRGNLCFSVARRWNSWYPSYFDVKGGCYLLMPGDLDHKNVENQKDSRIGVVVIDPGFGFIDILRQYYQIEPQDISTVIVTHYHPDHMVGLLEYATIMFTSKQQCDIYLNETTFKTFESLKNDYIRVHELVHKQIKEIMNYVAKDKSHVTITVKAVRVHHDEAGDQHRSLGLILETRRTQVNQTERSHSNEQYRIGILGDTDGNDAYIPEYIKEFRNMHILLLHLGTFSNKNLGKGGKHLYPGGVKKVIQGMGIGRLGDNEKTIFVLSEFGLELAGEHRLYCKLKPFIESHFWRLPLILTGLYLQEKKEAEEKKVTINEKVSRFFASGTFAILETTPTKEKKDELLLALGFQILECDDKEFPTTVEELKTELDTFISQKHITGGLAPFEQTEELPSIEQYEHLLKNFLPNKSTIEKLQTFFTVFVQRAKFPQPPLSFDKLLKTCNRLMEEIIHNLEDPFRIIYYQNKLEYISNYADARGLTGYNWVLSPDGKIKDWKVFWSACLIGICVLREVLRAHLPVDRETVSPKSSVVEENLLVRIGNFFQQKIIEDDKLLVGDIGCTFAIEPFEPPEKIRRMSGIWLKSAENKWISPYDAEFFYDEENDRISYRSPQKE